MIRNQRAFVSGALFLAIAVLYLWTAWPLDLGKGARMGPGYFPRLAGCTLGLLGLLIMANALRPSAEAERLEPWNWKGLFLITGGVVLFAALLEIAGFVISLVLMLLVASRASSEFTWRGGLLCIAALVVIGVGAFHYGLNLQFGLWPSF